MFRPDIERFRLVEARDRSLGMKICKIGEDVKDKGYLGVPGTVYSPVGVGGTFWLYPGKSIAMG